MPSPIGHALAGVAIAWTADLVDGRRSSARLLTACAGLAMVPDIDLLVPDAHRTATHSVTAAAVVFIIAVAVTGKVTRQAVLCAAAYASHLLLDWLGADNFPPRGLQVFWPFSRRWYISDLDLFRQTARQHFFTPPIIRRNTLAVAQEIAILAPIVVVLWLIRIKTTTRFSPEVARGHHPTE